MIYTVTFNPALDYVIRLDKLALGATNRVYYEQILGGGKGINVSMVLSNMGIDNTALGFCAGFTGEEILRLLDSFNCSHDFIKLKSGFSRINVKMKEKAQETEINGQGPDISPEEVRELLAKLENLKQGDILVLAGSIPKSLPNDIYQQIMAKLAPKNIEIVVDATKDLLLNVLPYKPFLIKPNQQELAEVFKVDLKDKKDIIYYGEKLQSMGARNVLISLGGNGAIFISENGQHHYCPVPKGELVNSTGAGDSMVAGFITGYVQTKNLYKAFLQGVATGSASAFSNELATKDAVDKLLVTMK